MRRGLAQLLAQGTDVHIHGTALAAVIHAPDQLHQPVAGVGRAGVAEEQAQQLVFLVGQVDAFAAGQDGVGTGVQRHLAAAEDGAVPLRLAAAQHRLDPGDQLDDAEGLGQIVVRAAVQRPDAVILRALGGGHNDRDAAQGRGGAHTAQQLRAVDAGEHHVQHHQIGLFALQGLPEGGAVGKALGLQPGGAQGIQLDIADAGVILYTPDHVGSLLLAQVASALCTPVTENITHSAMLVAWSPIRS